MDIGRQVRRYRAEPVTSPVPGEAPAPHEPAPHESALPGPALPEPAHPEPAHRELVADVVSEDAPRTREVTEAPA